MAAPLLLLVLAVIIIGLAAYIYHKNNGKLPTSWKEIPEILLTPPTPTAAAAPGEFKDSAEPGIYGVDAPERPPSFQTNQLAVSSAPPGTVNKPKRRSQR